MEQQRQSLPDSAHTGSSAPSHTANDSTFPRSDAFSEIAALARRSVSAIQFLSEAMRVMARHFSSPYASIYVRYASEVVQDECHHGAGDPRFWKASLQEFLTDALAEPRARAKLLRSRNGDARVAFLSAPIFDPTGPAIGAVALVLAPAEEEDVSAQLATLEAQARLASFAAEFLGGAEERDPLTPSRPEAAALSQNHRALAHAGACATLQELAFALVNELGNKLACEQVWLGMVYGRRVRVLAISGLDEVRPQSPGVATVRAAMEECLDAGTIIIAQPDGDWSAEENAPRFRLHQQWCAAAHGAAVASIPLNSKDNTVAVLGLRRRADRPLRRAELQEVRARGEPLAAAMLLLRRASRGWLQHGMDACKDSMAALVAPGRLVRKTAVVISVLAAIAFLFGSAEYHVSVPCTVRPAAIRHITAPYDALLSAVATVEGDRVMEGDLLCTLDHRELWQEREQLRAEIAVLERTRDRAMADDSPIEAKLALAQQHLMRTRLDRVERRIEQATVRAPIDGMVVSGDLRKRIGSVVQRGEPLFEVAPLTAWMLELAVPEHAAADVTTELLGSFVSLARPEASRPFRIDRVLGSARVIDGRNVLVAEADLAVAGPTWLRPGMEGVARIHVGPRRIWWIVLHRAVDYLRLNFWL